MCDTELAASALLKIHRDTGSASVPVGTEKLDGLSKALKGSCQYRQRLHRQLLDEQEMFRSSMERQRELHSRILFADEVMEQVRGVSDRYASE